MDPAAFCSQTRLLIVAGKGGVGKTTATAVLARLASRLGLNTLIVESEGKSGIAALFGYDGLLAYEEVVLVAAGGSGAAAEIRGRLITPDDALVEYLENHGMRRLSKRLVSSGAVDVVSTAAPGIKDILVLGKIKSLVKREAADLILLDAPAAGHAVTFLNSASALLDAIAVGPIREQAEEVVGLLSDGTKCQVLLVTLPEETPVNEVIETAFALEDRVGIKLAPVVINAVYEHLDGLGVDPARAAAEAEVALDAEHAKILAEAAAFRARRQALQEAQTRRLTAGLPLPQLRMPFVGGQEIGRSELDRLATALASSIEALPDPVELPDAPPARHKTR